MVEGTDIRDITRESLRTSYGMVLQDTWLRSGTIRDNITMGREGFSDEQIIAAAKEAHSYSFIKKMPKGLDRLISSEESCSIMSSNCSKAPSIENFVFAMTNLFIFYSFSLKPALPQPVHLKK